LARKAWNKDQTVSLATTDRQSGSGAFDFRKLTGHASTLAGLRNGGRRQPFPSLVFSGPSGVGKRLAAIWYAAFLNCLADDAAAPCGVCGACRKVLGAGHSDIAYATVPEAKTVIGVGEVREAIHQLQYAPFEGNFRVLIVENAEKLTDEAQNALLKTLEEPPKAAVIVLVTPLFGALIPTVASRCRAVRFSVLPEHEVAAHLVAQGADQGQANALARLCRGALGLALSMQSSPDDHARREEAVQLFLDLPGQDLWGATDTAQRLEKLKVGGVEAMIGLGASVYRDLLVLSGGCPELVCHEAHLSSLKEQAGRLSSVKIRKLLRVFAEADEHRASNVNPKILLQRLCARLAKGGD
jgi:DNA polymerase-3 subunit delta'